MNNIMRRFYGFIINYKNTSKYKELGVDHTEIRRLQKERGSKETYLFGKKLIFNNFFWYIHGLNELFIDKSYEFRSDTRTPLILDCGGNIGLSAIYFKRLYPEAKVITFEADKDIAKILRKNLDNFGYKDVEVVPKAVWTKNTTLKFQSDGGVGGQIVDNPDSNSNITEIEAIRLKDYLNQDVDFVKIDVEGAEYEILKDCAENLTNIKNLFIEYHSFLREEQMLDEILLILKKAGFKYYIKEAWNNMPIPFTDKRKSHYDLQLNIFAYRL